MRASIAAALLCAVLSAPAGALDTARSLAGSGAPHLALARVEQMQPRDTNAPRWAEWEALRLSLLVDLGRNDEALKRAAALPANLPPALARACLLSTARAAVAAGQGAQARVYAARVLWQLDPEPAEARAARLLVIESYLLERRGETAFHAMLRFEQDYRPLESAVAGRFADALLDLGLDREALNWLASLDETGPAKLRLRLRGGLITPDAAIAQARARFAPRQKTAGDPGYWRVLAEAAARKGDEGLRVEALERLLDQAGAIEARNAGDQAAELWKSYLALAQATANRGQLLTGDDKAWADLAARRLRASPVEARALFAFLSRNSRDDGGRLAAQHQLAFSLYQNGIDYAALLLFGEAPVETIDPKVRHLLGEIAVKRERPALAVRYWQGLEAPGGEVQEWQIRLAEAQWRSGAADASIATIQALAKKPGPLSRPAATRLTALARDAAAGNPELAEKMITAGLPLVTGNDARVLLSALGGIAETSGQYARAASYYLRAALVEGAPAADAPARQARLAAASNLARAGFREDARAQYQWLLKNSKDPVQLDAARRELARP